MNNLVLSPDFSIPAIDYAGQGNAILGIRDAGKSYTAMKAAEELMENNIPIIVYDPVGVWKNLKIGTGKHKGFPIVTAGGTGCDIKLTVNNASDIVRAAMKENVSLVIDLYSPELINKSSWIKIVQETIDILMYENKDYSMRHIFIEEAAEFIPQRLQPQHARVYASIERLARMGRNARLGYTIINQRAEEINKAILEISSLSLLHKQVGKNSLLSITKWLDVLQVENKSEIIKLLPSLKQGQCWAVGTGSQPHLIQVSPRKTFHPDPKKSSEIIDASKKKVDVSSWVERLNKLLTPEVPKVNINLSAAEIKKDSNLVSKLQQELVVVKKERDQALKLLDAQTHELDEQRLWKFEFKKQVEAIRKIIDMDPVIKIKKPLVKIETTDFKVVENLQIINKPLERLGKCPLMILQFLASYQGRSFSKVQIGVATEYSPRSSGFNNAISELRTKGLINREAGRIMVNRIPNLKEWTGDFVVKNYSIDTFKNNLGKCEGEIYQLLIDHPRQDFTKEELAAKTPSDYSPTSSGFNNAISKLNTLELIKRFGGRIRLNPELLEL